MDLDQLKQELHEGMLKPFYCLSGEETQIVDQALNLIIQAVLKKEEREHGMARLYADEKSVREVLEEALTLPFFTAKRVVVVRRVEAWEGIFVQRRRSTSQEDQPGQDEAGSKAEEGHLEAQRQSLLDYLACPNPTTHVILIAGRADGRLPVVRRLKEMGAFVECSAMKEQSATRWVTERAKQAGLRLSKAGASRLVEHVGPDLQRLAREVEKLADFSLSQQGDDVEAIELLVAGGRERNAFDLSDAIAGQETEKALRRLNDLLTFGEGEGPIPPIVILSKLTWQMRRVWLVKDSLKTGLPELETYNRVVKAPVKALSGWHRNRLRELRETAERFSDEGLTRAWERLLQADLELKGEGTNPRRTLEALVIDLCEAGEENGA